MKTQKFIWYVLLLAFSGLVYLFFFTYQNVRRNKESFRWVTHSHEVLENINAVRSSVLDVESQVRGYVISGNPVFIQHYNDKRDALFRTIEKLNTLASGNPEQQENSAALQELAGHKMRFQNHVLDSHRRSPVQAQQLIASLEGKSFTDSMESILQTMEVQEQQLLSVRLERNDHYIQQRYTTTVFLSLTAFGLLAVLLMKIAREIRLRRQAEEQALLSEHKYKGLIENSALVVHATDLEGNFTYLSGKCKDLTGFTPEELLGENYLSLIDENWQEKAKAFYSAQIEKQTFETVLEFPITAKNGERHWLEQSTVLVQKNGKLTGFQSIAKDITERKYAEKLLAEAELRLKAKQEEYQERLQAILDNMPMIVYLKDMEGRFMMVNRQFHQTFGTTDDEVIGRTEVNVHKTEEGARKFADADEEVKRTGKPIEVEDLVLTREGERNMLIIKFPLLDKNNELFAISAVGKDVTEIVRYQRQLIVAKMRAEKAERLQEEFLANMSHEIRTPMNGIIGMANLLETTILNTEQRDYLHLIQESSGILLSLINNILDLSKIKSGRMSVENADFNLNQTIDSIAAPFVLKTKEKGIALKKILQDVPTYVKGDQHKLQQVLNNLLSNAVKFTQEGSVTLSATTEAREGDALYLILRVTDTGIGIAPENQEQVFESFVQAGSDMVRRFGGTGLGLSITKRLIELQGGKITVSSTLGEGTSFTVELPLVLGEGISETPAALPLEKEIPAHSLKGKSVLLIEDNLVNQKVTYLMLHKAGMLVNIANHGKEAVELLQQKSYDLIITDLQMPEMDGFQTAVFIRNKLHLKTPIIAMTASALRNEKDRCLELGMNEYLTKPFAPATLFFHLKRFLLAGGETGTASSATQPEEKQEGLYNLAFLHEMEDDDYTAEVLNLFLDSTPEILAQIKDANFREEWDEVYKKAHSLKSSLGILQMNAMLHTVTQIEALAKNQTNTDAIEAFILQAVQQYNLVKPMLEAELETI